MADNDRNDNGRRPSRGRPDDRRSSGPRGDRPSGKGGAKGKPFRSRASDRDGERPFRKPRFEEDRPFRKPHRDTAGGPRKRFEGPRDERPARNESPRPARDERPRPAREEVHAPAAEPTEERIAKVIARAGVASRRDAEAMIAEGRVTLNGEVLTSPAVNVTAADRITVDGEPLPARERTRLWIFHKPRGLVTTARDPQGRPTVFESLPEDMPRVVAVGRLDINTEGLLLLTNDGGLARVIAHPDTGWLRRYKVRAHGEITQEQLEPLRDGISIEGIDYGPIEARLDRIQGDNAWITMGLREGKNREIKNILEHLGLNVNRLIRLSFGPFQLGDLEPGLVEEVRTKVLREQLGQKLAEAAGVDFESPVREPIAPFGSPKREERSGGERPERSGGRPERGGGRFGRDRDDDRPRHGRDRDGERPFRSRDERPTGRQRDEAAPRPPQVHGTERRPSVWRAEDDAEAGPKRMKPPRRGADPKEARAASGGRQRERVGAIAQEGRRVVVERLISEPTPAGGRPTRRPRGEAPRAPSGDDRPRRREAREFGDRPQRRPRDEGTRPGRESDERPRSGFRADGPRPFRGGPRNDGPRRGPGGGGFGKGPKGVGPRGSGPRGSGGTGPRGSGPKGPGRKGPPRDRRS